MKEVILITFLLILFAFSNTEAQQRKSNKWKVTHSSKTKENLTTELNIKLKIVVDSISKLMSLYHYNPEELTTKEYLEIETKAKLLAKKSTSKEDFVEQYNVLWTDGPFSHVLLAQMQHRAKDIAKHIDNLRVGERGAMLEWMDETAILTVTTMNGVDTKERVFKAFKQIADKKAKNLIIDLRNNKGGTFAGIPLIAHLISDSIDVGTFISQKWWRKNIHAPTQKDTKQLTPWQGWSIETFWHDVQEKPLTRVKIYPMTPRFSGRVYVLINNTTFSAAELTTDALTHVENLTLIGETTGGQMLSQKMYDLPMGLQLSLPIADYYSARIGRIEGQGVAPNIAIDPKVAKELAFSLIEGIVPEKAIQLANKKLAEMEELPFAGITLHLFGSMNKWGKKWNKTPKFDYKGNGIFTTTIKLTKGKYEFKMAPMDWKFDFGAFDNKQNVIIGHKTPLVKKPGSPNLILEIEDEDELIFHLDVSSEYEAFLSVSKK